MNLLIAMMAQTYDTISVRKKEWLRQVSPLKFCLKTFFLQINFFPKLIFVKVGTSSIEYRTRHRLEATFETKKQIFEYFRHR